MRFLRYITATLALAVAAQAMMAGVPSGVVASQVNGSPCYLYNVERGESVHSIISRLGITRQQLVQYNPSAADGVRPGMRLFFPTDLFDGNTPETETYTTHKAAKGETLFGIANKYKVSVDALLEANPELANGVKVGMVVRIPQGNTTAVDVPVTPVEIPETRELTPVNPPVKLIEPDSTATSSAPATAVAEHFTVALLLPFMLDEEKPGKAAEQITDFYRGFLLGVDTLVNMAPKIDIVAVDTHNSLSHVRNILSTNQSVQNAAIIVAPDNVDQFNAIADYAKGRNMLVLNNVSARDSAYLTNAQVLQGPIPSPLMLNTAAAVFSKQYANCQVVFLLPEDGRNDKLAFVDDLRTRLIVNGSNPLNIRYSGTLSVSELTEQLPEVSAGTRLVFVPASGNVAEFNKFAPSLARFARDAAASGAEVSLLGYPEWATFRSDALDLLYTLSASIYSRSFYDPKGYGVTGVADGFRRWYGRSMSQGVPCQALLGFDTANFIIRALADGGITSDNLSECDYEGVQSAYRFRHIPGVAGAVNTALYIVHYMPNKELDITIVNTNE